MNTNSDSNRVAAADTVVDRENPWPGLRAYDERGKDYFKGRRDVARELARLIVREDLVLLYGISGLGKTSLLRAGVFPDLPPNFLPVYVRLNFVSADAEGARNGRRLLTSSDLTEQVVAAAQESARQRNVEPPLRPLVPERGLWEYFRRADDGFWGPGGLLMTPVLVFDQFEEIFTRMESPNAAPRHFEEFLHDLANLESGREPAWYESTCATDEMMERPAYTRQPGVCKVVLSFREDYLANIKGLSRIIPSIDRIFMRLEPMTRKAAARAICEAGEHLVEGKGDKTTLRTSIRIIRKVTGASGRLAEATVDPALLSLFCRELNEKRKATPGALIDRPLVDSAEASQILTTFYANAMRDVDPATRRFVEDTLVLPGTRSRWPAAEPMALAAGVPAADLELLTRKRILRRDMAAGVARFELTHDVLVDVVIESRARRLDQEKLAQERAMLEVRSKEARQRLERETARAERQRKLAVRIGMMAGALVVLLVITAFALYSISRLEHEQRARNWADAAYTEAPRNGRLSTVLGLRALDESELAGTEMPLALMALNNAVRVPHLQLRIGLDRSPQRVAVSGDGANVALLVGPRLIELWKAPPASSPPVRLNLADDFFSMTFDRRGSELLIVYQSTAVDRVDLKAGEMRLQNLAPAIGGQRTTVRASVSPDGERLLVASQKSAYLADEPQWLSAFDRRAARWLPPIPAAPQESFILAGDATAYAMLGSDGQLSFTQSTGSRASIKLGETTLVGLNVDGSRLFAVRRDANVFTLVIVSLQEGTSWSVTLPSAAEASSALFSGDRLAVMQADRLSVWDLAGRRPLFEVKNASRFAWLGDTERLLTASAESVDVWDARSGRLIERVSGHDDEVTGVASAEPGGLPVTIAGQGLYFWYRPRIDRVVPTGMHAPNTLLFSADGSKLITASEKTIQIHDLQSGSASSIAAPSSITALALAPNDDRIAIGTADGQILLRGLEDSSDSRPIVSGAGEIRALAFGASERQLAWAAQAQAQEHTTAVTLRDLGTKQDVVSQQIPGDVVAMAVAGQRVAVGLVKPPDYAAHTNNPAREAAGAMEVALVGNLVSEGVAAASTHRPSSKRGELLPQGPLPAQTDTPLPSSLLTPTSYAGAPTSRQQPCYKGIASMSSNFGFAATGISCEQTVVPWNDLSPVMPLKVEGQVARIAVSPDGNYLALAYVDGSITLHHTALPFRSVTLAGAGDDITSLAFDKQAARLAAARADGSVAIFLVGGSKLREAAKELVPGQNPTPEECLRLFGASNQCEEMGDWHLMTQRILRPVTGR